MRSPCADGVAQSQRRRADEIGEECAVDGNKRIVLNPAGAPEVAFRRSNGVRKIGPGGETAPLCCDVKFRIVMVAGGSEIFYFAIFRRKN